MAGLDVALAYGDLRDPAALKLAAAGCGRVFHCAAMLSTVPGHERELYDCNVLGTRNLLAACRDAGVERVVVTGSFSAVGHVAGRPSVEEMPFYPFGKLLPYAHTKALVEHECLKAVVDGLDVVVAVSTAILGPHDDKPSRMGRLLLDFARRQAARLPARRLRVRLGERPGPGTPARHVARPQRPPVHLLDQLPVRGRPHGDVRDGHGQAPSRAAPARDRDGGTGEHIGTAAREGAPRGGPPVHPGRRRLPAQPPPGRSRQGPRRARVPPDRYQHRGDRMRTTASCAAA